MRVDRLLHGNSGKHRVLTEGIVELKIDVGPGYRVYFTERDETLILLLIGGGQIDAGSRYWFGATAGKKFIGCE